MMKEKIGCNYSIYDIASGTKEDIAVSSLGEYTIVYPEDYTELRLDVPTMLADAIEKTTGKRPKIKCDKVKVCGKKIILASGKTKTTFSGNVKAFSDGISFIIAEDKGNIVLGGKNYYADSNAVYYFIENYLGIDIAENTVSEPAEKISGAKAFIHEKPELLVQASMWASAITDIKMVKYLYEANFNCIMYTYWKTSEKNLHDIVRWCTKYGVYIILNRGVVYPDVYRDCPLILGHYIWDEPTENDYATVLPLLAEYKQKYAKYGWRAWVNFVGSKDCMQAFDAEKWVFDDMDVTGIDAYAYVIYFYGRDKKHFIPYEMIRNSAREHDLEVWNYIQSYDHVDSPVMNTSKAYIWQMQHTMCFGPDGIMYFEYGNMEEGTGGWSKGWDTTVIGRDFLTRGQHYYDAQRANKIMLEEAKLLKGYEQVGVGEINRKPDDNYTLLEHYYDFSNVLSDINGYDKDDVYFVGCFKKKDGYGKAYLITDMTYPDDRLFDDTPIKTLKAKIRGEKVTAFFNGRTFTPEKDEDGYYSLPIGNGFAVLVTVE